MVGAGYCNRVSLLSVVSAGSAAPTSTRRRGVRTYAWRVEEKFGGSESKIRVSLLPHVKDYSEVDSLPHIKSTRPDPRYTSSQCVAICMLVLINVCLHENNAWLLDCFN